MSKRKERRKSRFAGSTSDASERYTVLTAVAKPVIAAAAIPQMGILVLLSLALTLPSLRFDFVWDDPYLISSNHLVTGPLSFRGLISSTLVLKQLPMPFYRPMQLLVHAIEYRLFDLQAWGYHLVSAFLHTLVVILVFLVGRRLFPSPWAALFGAVLFAIHPVHAEPVSFISAQGDLLSTLFALLAFAAIIGASQAATLRGIALASVTAAVALLAAMLSKESAILLPVAFLAYLWFEPGPAGRALSRARAFTVAGIALGVSGLLYFWLRKNAMALGGGTGLPLDPGGVLRRFASYIRLLLDPTAIRIYWPAVPSGWSPGSLIGLLLGFGGFFLALLPGTRRALRILLWLWFCLTLLPSLKVFSFPGADIATRYAYLPSVAAAWGLAMAYTTFNKALTTRALRMIAVTVAVVLSLVLTISWYREQNGWKDRISLYARMAQESPNFAMVHFNLANSLSEAGRKDEAAGEYRTALRLKPDYADAHFRLGSMLAGNSQDTLEALTHLRAYLALRPQAPDREPTLQLIRALGSRLSVEPGKGMQ